MEYKKIKIVATIGPKTSNKKALENLYSAGMSVARLNGSHNTLEWHSKVISLIKSTLPSVPILFDIPGKKIRTAQLKFEPKFNVSDEIILTTQKGFDGKNKVSLNNEHLHKYLSIGDVILADDSILRFTVLKIVKKDIYCRAEVKGVLRSAKGINVPHIHLGGKFVNSRDRKIIKFAIANDVDFVGISFVESKKHINAIKKLIKFNKPKIVSKIENQAGLDNLEEISKETDVIMIDRGDLSNETNFESIAIFQKRIIKKATQYAKPVIVATEMLHTMINNPYPTKAEVADISNAVLDGASAIMLSGETAIGKYPKKSVEVMCSIAEKVISEREYNIQSTSKSNISQAIGESISVICNSLPITKVIVITVTGFAARIVSSQRIKQPILAMSNDLSNSRSFNMLSGTKGIYINMRFKRNSLDHVADCLKHLWKIKEIKDQDLILVTTVGYPYSGQRMNMIQTHKVTNLRKLFNW